MRAYPRRRGGNDHPCVGVQTNPGLSPQARGEHQRAPERAPGRGPIPAGAGGTMICRYNGHTRWAYPRRRGGNQVCREVGRHRGAYPRRRGGNSIVGGAAVSWAGLSPQARGEPRHAGSRTHEDGPIPAGAGGTSCMRAGGPCARAYPRRRGGNQSIERIFREVQGLSPQARGERQKPLVGPGRRGPIPAGAGGTRQ